MSQYHIEHLQNVLTKSPHFGGLFDAVRFIRRLP